VSNVDSKVDVSGEGMFYLPEYGLKFKTLNGTSLRCASKIILNKLLFWIVDEA
jgi:hypothetical protein